MDLSTSVAVRATCSAQVRHVHDRSGGGGGDNSDDNIAMGFLVCSKSYYGHIYMCVCLKVTYADCCEIVSTCKSSNVILAVGYVLRYLPEVHKITELIRSGVLGNVVCIQHTEPVCQSVPVVTHLQSICSAFSS